MVNELVDVYSRMRLLEGEISLLNYRIDKMSDLLNEIAENGQIIADDGIVEELPVDMLDDGK